MARYAQRYEESLAQIRKLEAKLADATFYKDQFRAFINEAGHSDAFLRWIAKRQGLDLACLKPDANAEQPAHDPRDDFSKENNPFPGIDAEQNGEQACHDHSRK
jgi:hypothetical protein